MTEWFCPVLPSLTLPRGWLGITPCTCTGREAHPSTGIGGFAQAALSLGSDEFRIWLVLLSRHSVGCTCTRFSWVCVIVYMASGSWQYLSALSLTAVRLNQARDKVYAMPMICVIMVPSPVWMLSNKVLHFQSYYTTRPSLGSCPTTPVRV